MSFDGSNWNNVGKPGFSAGPADYISLSVYDGNPYVAYRDAGNNGKVSVMMYNGSEWNNIGKPGFSAGTAYYTSLYVYNGIPYVVYEDFVSSNKATVLSFSGLLPKPHNRISGE